jgi:hypothetical protein
MIQAFQPTCLGAKLIANVASSDEAHDSCLVSQIVSLRGSLKATADGPHES